MKHPETNVNIFDVKIPTHIVKIVNTFPNRINPYTWINMVTNETYKNDEVLAAYLKTYTPLPEWYTWESYQKKRGRLAGKKPFSLSM